MPIFQWINSAKFWPETDIYVGDSIIMNIAESEKLINLQSISEDLKLKVWRWRWIPREWKFLTLCLPAYHGAETVYMFYLNWQTFRQTSIMCNVNILSINYITTSTLILRFPLEKLFTSEISKHLKSNQRKQLALLKKLTWILNI